MMQDINKRVLVTASSKGLGKAIAKEFAFNGYDIILNGRDETKVYDTQFEINHNISSDVMCESVIGDLRSNDVIEKLYKVSKGNISVLVNNAAIPCYGLSLDEMDEYQISNSLETNLVAPIKLTRKIYPLLKKQGYGSIININSIVGKEPKKFRSVHSATKWGLKGFSKSLRLEAKENGIKVINVYPTQIKTVKEHTYGLEPHDVAKKIYEEHNNGDTGELVLDGRPEEFRR
jgi:3-oxoacyl-[acyl-carrier protein] reductase